MYVKRWAAIFLILVLLFCGTTGCATKDDYVVYVELDAQPKTLDPQLASGTTEEMLARNLFEGLTRLDASGEAIPGAATDIAVSQDAKTYTFTLSNEAKWSDESAVSAADFAFGLQRALSVEMAAPYASRLFCIENAAAYHAGNSAAKPGIEVVNDTTLVIRLHEKNDDFLKILASSVAMPCNKTAFAKAKGQYGLDGKHLVSNGSFKLRFWDKGKDFSLRMNANPMYCGKAKSETAAVIFSAGELNGRAAKIAAGQLDMGLVNYTETTDDTKAVSFERTCYALIMNKQSDIGNLKIRQAFEMTIHRNLLQNELGRGLTETGLLLPEVLRYGNASLRAQVTVDKPLPYAPEQAHSLYVAGVKQVGEPKNTSVLYCGGDTLRDMVTMIAGRFQQVLGAYVNVEAAADEQELNARLAAGEYQLAIVPLTAQNDKPVDFLSRFVTGNTQNRYGFQNKKYDALVATLSNGMDAATYTNTVSKALNLLAGDHSVIPLAQYTEAFAYMPDFAVPAVSPFNGMVDFAAIRKGQ